MQFTTHTDTGCLRACAQLVMGHTQELMFDVERYHRLLGQVGQLACPGSRLLRHYVYDGVRLGWPTESQLAIDRAADFTGRWGKINVQGAQKGVDTMIAVDIAMMACRRIVDDVILVGSDFDIHAGFEAAKSSSARVHLVDLEAVGSRPCLELLLSADSVIAWTLEQFEGVLRPAPEKVLATVPEGRAGRDEFHLRWQLDCEPGAARPQRNALMSVKDFGDYMMAGSEAGIVAGVAMIGVAEGSKHEVDSMLGNAVNIATFGASTAIAGAAAGSIQAVGYLIIFFCVGLFAWSAAIAVYLPLAPFLIFFGAFIGWLILCAEAVVAAPLWAIMHLSPEGEGLMGGARQGYMLIWGLLLRPVLIVMGFIFALAAMNLVAQGFNQIFFPAFKLASNGSVVGLGTSFVLVMIFFGTMVWIFHTILGLVHIVPDKVLTWMGGGREQLGDTARSMSKRGSDGAAWAGRHAEGLQRNMVQGLAAKAAMDAGRERRQDDAASESRGAEMKMKDASSKSALANAKAASEPSPEAPVEPPEKP